ncbi:Translocation protein S66, partial [Coemansia spiralis]
RKARSLAKLEAWYPTHTEREIFYSLVELQETAEAAVPTETLRAALFRRAMTDIMRAVDIKMNKQTLTSLVKSGAMSEDLLHQFNAAEAENDAEMMSVVQEAEKLQKGWGGSIFYAASEMVNNTRLRELREEMLKMNFESANCARNIMMEEMTPEAREKATTAGTAENEALTKHDVILSSIFNMPIGEGVKVAQAAQAKMQEEANAKEQQKQAKAGKKQDTALAETAPEKAADAETSAPAEGETSALVEGEAAGNKAADE